MKRTYPIVLMAFIGMVFVLNSISAAAEPPMIAAGDDFVDSKGSSTFIDPLSNDAVFGLRALDPLSFQIIDSPKHGSVSVSATSSGVEVGYFRNEPGPDPVGYEVCLVDGACDTATLWFLEGNVGPLVSAYPDRREPIELTRAALSGNVFIFVPDLFPSGSVGSVRFLLNGEPFGIEREAPYDLAGGMKSFAYPFDTTVLNDGQLSLTTEIKFIQNGSFHIERIDTTAKLANSPLLAFSYSADRSSASALDGAFFGGNIYIFIGILPLNPGIGPIPWNAEGVASVRFFIDGVAVRTENVAPYDLGGGSISVASPFDLSSISKGRHEMRAVISYTTGKQIIVAATFEVIG